MCYIALITFILFQQLLAKDISSDEDAATNKENKSKNRYANILARM